MQVERELSGLFLKPFRTGLRLLSEQRLLGKVDQSPQGKQHFPGDDSLSDFVL